MRLRFDARRTTGVLSADEFRNAFMELSEGDVDAASVDKIMGKVDKNKDRDAHYAERFPCSRGWRVPCYLAGVLRFFFGSELCLGRFSTALFPNDIQK